MTKFISFLLVAALTSSLPRARGMADKPEGSSDECLIPAEIEMLVEGMKLVYANEGQKASDWFMEGCKNLEEGKFARSCACHYWAFRSHADVNRTEDADRSFLCSLSLAPKDPMLRSIHAERLAQSENFTAAATEFLLAAELYERRHDAQDKDEHIMRNYYNAATSFVQVGNAEDALEAYKKVVGTRKGKSKWAVYNSMGLLLYDMMRDEEAIHNFKLALSIHRNHPAVLRNLAGVYLRADNASEAVQLLQLSAEMEPTSFESWFYLGGAHARLQQHRAAAQSFANATLLHPNNSDAHRFLGEERFELEDYKRAINAMRTATRLISQQSLHGGCDVFSSLGRMLLELGKYDDALAVFKKALHRCECTFHPQPDQCKPDPWQLVDLGTAEMLLGLWSDANASFSAAMELNPSLELSSVMVDSLYTRACLLDLTARAEGVEGIEEALEEEPTPPWMVQHLNFDQRKLTRWTELYAVQRTQRTLSIFHELPPLTPSPFAPRLPLRIGLLLCSQEMRGADINAVINIIRLTTSNGSTSKLTQETMLLDWCKNPPVDNEDGEETSGYVDWFEELGYRPNTLREVEIGRGTSYDDARKINEEQVHVLISFDGWRRRNRNEILAHRPCQLQVNMLGHRGSMGSETLVDFLLAGKISTPPELQDLYTEKLAYNPFGYLAPCASRMLSGFPSLTCLPSPPTEQGESREENNQKRKVFGMFGPPQSTSYDVVNVVDESLHKLSDVVLSLPPHPSLSTDKLAAIFPKLCSNQSTSHLACRIDRHADVMLRLKASDVIIDTWSISAGPVIGQALAASKRIITFPQESLASRTGAEHAIMMGCADCAILRASLEFASWSEAYGRSERSGARDTQGGYLEQLASRCPWAQEVVRTLKVGLDTKLSTERPYHLVMSVLR